MAMVEQEQAHRISYERTRLDGEVAGNRRSHLIGGSITILAIVVAAVAGYVGVNPIIPTPCRSRPDRDCAPWSS